MTSLFVLSGFSIRFTSHIITHTYIYSGQNNQCEMTGEKSQYGRIDLIKCSTNTFSTFVFLVDLAIYIHWWSNDAMHRDIKYLKYVPVFFSLLTISEYFRKSIFYYGVTVCWACTLKVKGAKTIDRQLYKVDNNNKKGRMKVRSLFINNFNS